MPEYFERTGALKVRRGNGPLNPDYRLILRGHQERRILDRGFSGGAAVISGDRSPYLLADRFGPFGRHSYSLALKPEGKGLKILVHERIHSVDRICAGEVFHNGSIGTVCNGQTVSYPEEFLPERFNWFFNDCHTRGI